MKLKVLQTLIVCSIILFQFVFNHHLNGQSLIYEGFIKGEKVGELNVIREVNDENVKIIVHTSFRTPETADTTAIFTESMYVDQSLMQAAAITKLNNQVLADVETIRMHKGYRHNFNGKRSELNSKTLIGTDIFYFEEPVSIDSIYSLKSGKMLDVLASEEPSVYCLKDGDEEECYAYQQGVLQQIRMSQPAYNIIFRLKK